MQQPWENDDCAAIKALYAVYSIPEAAALWCGVPDDQIDKIVEEATPISNSGPGQSIWKHPSVPCIEPRSRAIAEAMGNGALAYGREDGSPVAANDNVAQGRRHFSGRNLKKWMEKALPNEKPAFLFDDIERSSHTDISQDAYQTLKAEHDKLEKRLENTMIKLKKLRGEKGDIVLERNSLKAMVDNIGAPGERAESTYQNIIAALLGCIAGNHPSIEKHPSFPSEAKLIETIGDLYQGYKGLSKSNLSRKFPEAKKSLDSQ